MFSSPALVVVLSKHTALADMRHVLRHGQLRSYRSEPLLMRYVQLVVAAALITTNEGEEPLVLLAQRPPGKSMEGLWEFPVPH